jgi:hypothetical protein
MRVRFRWIAGGALMAILIAGAGAGMAETPAANGTATAPPRIDYGATMTVLAGARMPEPAIQQAWRAYFEEIGAQAASAEHWPADLVFESVDVDYELDRETRAVHQAAGEYELEHPDNHRYASAVVAIQPSASEATAAVDAIAHQSDASAYSVGIAPEIGDTAICLIRTEGTAVEAICTAQAGDTLVTALWASDIDTADRAQQQAATLAHAFVSAVESEARPSR